MPFETAAMRPPQGERFKFLRAFLDPLTLDATRSAISNGAVTGGVTVATASEI